MSTIFAYQLSPLDGTDISRGGTQVGVIDRRVFLVLTDWLASDFGIRIAIETEDERASRVWKVTRNAGENVLRQLKKKGVTRELVASVASDYGLEEQFDGDFVWRQFSSLVSMIDASVQGDLCLVLRGVEL